jgi:hypothetical protein
MNCPSPASSRRSPLAFSLLAAATALTLAGCGGGGGGQGFAFAPAPAPVSEAPKGDAPAPAPSADTPAPAPAPGVDAPAPAPGPAPAPSPGGDAPAPAPAPTPAPPAPAPAPVTWRDADCSINPATTLPNCSIDFSDNNAKTTVVPESNKPAIELRATADALAPTFSSNNGLKGNKAVYGLTFLDKVPLTELTSASFKMKLGTTTPPTTMVDAYVTVTISLNCDGLTWVNLLTYPSEMQTSGPDEDGYTTYALTPGGAQWRRSGANVLKASDGTLLLNAAYGNNSLNGPMSLNTLIIDYPKACVYNFGNPNANNTNPPGPSFTPAVVFNLSDSNNIVDKLYWIKDLKIVDKTVF